MEVKPNVQTYICLLNACAADGRVDRAYVTIYFFHYLILYYKLLLALITVLFSVYYIAFLLSLNVQGLLLYFQQCVMKF